MNCKCRDFADVLVFVPIIVAYIAVFIYAPQYQFLVLVPCVIAGHHARQWLQLACPDPEEDDPERPIQSSREDSTAINVEAQRSSTLPNDDKDGKAEISIISPSSYISNECTICCERARNVVLIKCGHLICKECARAVMSTRECPFCRGHIRHAMPIII